MSILNVTNVTHYFGDKLVFKDIEFSLLKNERVGLVGANGSGKSTLLNVISGEILPDSGEIEWIGSSRVGFLEQHHDLPPGVTIRGYLGKAFQHLYDAENEMLRLSEKMGDCSPGELEQQLKRFGEIQDLLERHEFYLIDAKIEEIANGLGIMALGLETDVDQLSGGQRTKLLLAKLLLEKPEILLLDEPTNYLDYEHITWLTEYLKGYPYSFILVSHDTDFMNAVVNIVYHLEHKRLTRYLGNYQQFLKTYEFRKQQQHIAYSRQQQEIQKLETYIAKNKVRASTSKQAKSREKKLLKIDRIQQPDRMPKPKFSFQIHERSTSTVVEIKDLQIGYERALVDPMTFVLKRGQKVAITGYNGIGKSTTLKTILGEISPIDGEITFGQKVFPAYFAQEWHTQSEQTPIEYIWGMHSMKTQKEIRQALARCGLQTEHIFSPLASLSGGEQTKVRICQLMLERSNWLILDEPTNHLDIQAKEALQIALQQYEGTILLVSHEPSFYQDWVSDVWDLETLCGIK